MRKRRDRSRSALATSHCVALLVLSSGCGKESGTVARPARADAGAASASVALPSASPPRVATTTGVTSVPPLVAPTVTGWQPGPLDETGRCEISAAELRRFTFTTSDIDLLRTYGCRIECTEPPEVDRGASVYTTESACTPAHGTLVGAPTVIRAKLERDPFSVHARVEFLPRGDPAQWRRRVSPLLGKAPTVRGNYIDGSLEFDLELRRLVLQKEPPRLWIEQHGAAR